MYRKELNKKNAKNISNVFALLIVLIILFLTIGYSAFQNTGIISDMTATVRPDMNIKITDLQIENTSDAIVVSKDYNSINNNNGTYTGKILGDLTFTKTTSSVTYKVEVTNFGNVEMGVSSISGLPSNLTYEIDTTTYDIGEKLCDKTTTTKCTLGSKTDIYITIKYKSGSGTNTSTNLSIVLDLTFKTVHNIYYGGIAIDYVLDGENKTVSLGTNAPDYIEISGTSTSHSYTKPNVTVNGVTSDITIEELHKIYLDNTELDTVVHGGNKTVSLGSNAPSSESNITITGTYTSKSYTNPNLTLNVVTSDIYITISSGGSGGGDWSEPTPDNETTTYDPENIPPDSTIIYNAVDGAPQVQTDENGNVTRFEYTNSSSNNPVELTGDNPVQTGFIPFDGTSNWELDMRYRWKWADNTGTGSTVTTTLSCMDWSSGSLSSGFGIRHSARKATSSTTTPKTNLFLNVSVNDSSATHYLYNTSSSGRIYTDPMDFTVHITKVGSTMTFTITANGSLKYNPTRDNASSNGVTTTTNESVTKTWQDNGSSSSMDITIGGYVNSSGDLTQKANIDVISFSVRKTN